MFDVKKMGKRIKELRGKASQDECAEKLGISRGALSFYEQGKRTPDAEIIYRMCEYFNVSSDYLLGLTNNSTTNTDLQAVCAFTGLNEETVNAVISLKNMQICDIADYFISSIDFKKMMCYLDAMKRQMCFIGNEYGIEITSRTFENIYIDDFYKRIQNGENVDFFNDIICCNDKADNIDLAIYNILKMDAKKCFDRLIDKYKEYCVLQASELLRKNEERGD